MLAPDAAVPVGPPAPVVGPDIVAAILEGATCKVVGTWNSGGLPLVQRDLTIESTAP